MSKNQNILSTQVYSRVIKCLYKNIHQDDVDDNKVIRKQEKKLKKQENQKMGKIFKNWKKMGKISKKTLQQIQKDKNMG